MERYFIRNDYSINLIIESDASVKDIQEAIKNYLFDDEAIKAASEVVNHRGQSDDDRVTANIKSLSIAMRLKAMGFRVSVLAFGYDSVDDYTKQHFGGRSIVRVSNVTNSPHYNDIYTGSEDQEPLTRIVQNYGTQFVHKHELKINEVKRYVREVLNQL